MASTTSTENSGLFGHILPLFQETSGIEVRVVAQGTGQALETGRRGDADVVFVHARAQEDAVRRRGLRRRALRRDVQRLRDGRPGRRSRRDPGGESAAEAMAAIAAAGAPFASRGDDSGTHAAELALWKAAGVAPAGDWYRETGSGMGPTLNTASQMDAYALADRGTWLSFANRGDLEILVEGDPALFNPYGVILVNPAEASAREGGGRAGVHRLAGLARGAGGDRRLQDRRRAAVLPRRERLTEVRAARSGSCR